MTWRGVMGALSGDGLIEKVDAWAGGGEKFTFTDGGGWTPEGPPSTPRTRRVRKLEGETNAKTQLISPEKSIWMLCKCQLGKRILETIPFSSYRYTKQVCRVN